MYLRSQDDSLGFILNLSVFCSLQEGLTLSCLHWFTFSSVLTIIHMFREGMPAWRQADNKNDTKENIKKILV